MGNTLTVEPVRSKLYTDRDTEIGVKITSSTEIPEKTAWVAMCAAVLA